MFTSVLQAQKTGEEYIIFLYDENGSAYGMLLKNGTAETYYYYTFNVQGDIVGIIDSTGTQVVSYEYGIWGDNTVITGTLADTIGNKNPLRYRSYYFDAETGFYYLQSRYYDPEVYRFINADGYISTGQDINCYNMFAYCGNDPVNKCDPNGRFFLTATICGVAIWKIGLAIIASVALIVAADSIAKNPPSIPSISLPKTNSKPKTDSKPKAGTKEKDITAPPPSNGKTYYHVTTPNNAAAIIATGVMTGSKWESGYIYAWKANPNKYAIENSGAHMGVTISFKTNASFVMDTGITDPKVQMYGPMVSTTPGPIVVWDVQIVR